MIYRHSFPVKATLDEVTKFHLQPGSMGAITPPPVIVQIHRSPPALSTGAEMEFTLWLGPLPIRWLARIEAVADFSFVDRQVRGPFKQWVHRHTFTPISEAVTQVKDEVEAELQDSLFWKLVGLAMWLSLPVLFAFRAWRTRKILE